MILSIQEIKNKITPICQEYKISKAYIFGSYARGEANNSSDIDIHVSAGENSKLHGLLALSGFKRKLKEILNCEIDIITYLSDDKLDADFVRNVMRDEVLIYEAI